MSAFESQPLLLVLYPLWVAYFSSLLFFLRSFDRSSFIIIVLLPLEVSQCAHDTQCMPNTSQSLRDMFCFHAVLFLKYARSLKACILAVFPNGSILLTQYN